MKIRLTCSLAVILCAIGNVSAQSDLTWVQDAKEHFSQPAEAFPWLTPPELSPSSRKTVQGIDQSSKEVLQRIERSRAPSTVKTAAEGDFKLGAPLILVSLSIPDSELAAIVKEAVDSKAILVFRGVPKGGKIKDLMRALRRHVSDPTHAPNVVLNPEVFRELGTTEVPQLAVPVGDGSQFVTLKGSANVEYVRKRVAAANIKRGVDLGRTGNTWPISEADFVEEMKARIVAIDWEKQKERAINRFWKKQEFLPIPEVRRNASYLYDPTLVLMQDVTNGAGKVLMAAGASINPLTRMPLTKRYIVFDARKSWQVEKAVKLQETTLKAGKPVGLIMTAFDTDKGWEGFEGLHKRFRAPVYVLNKQLAQRLHVRAVPATFEAEGEQMRVTEFAKEGP